MWWRAYLVKAKTNENVRTVDFEADDRQQADAVIAKELRRGERVDQVVGIQP